MNRHNLKNSILEAIAGLLAFVSLVLVYNHLLTLPEKSLDVLAWLLPVFLTGIKLVIPNKKKPISVFLCIGFMIDFLIKCL